MWKRTGRRYIPYARQSIDHAPGRSGVTTFNFRTLGDAFGKVSTLCLKSAKSLISGQEMAHTAGSVAASSRRDRASATAFWRRGFNSTEKSYPKSLLT